MRLETVRWARRFLLLIVVGAIVIAVWSAWRAAGGSGAPAWLRIPFLQDGRFAGRHIGLVAGHSGNDSGAVCPDGLQEVQVNQAVVDAATRALRKQGASVDVLKEFDRRLSDFKADAFVSVHADSCEVDLSGFKVASLDTPPGNAVSKRLTDCLWERYGALTGLSPDPDTITYDMSRYHAFREISPTTPAAIIEIGFLKGDRDLLTGQPDRVAAGIVAGLQCFLAY